MRPIKVMTIFGTRPETIKLAPVINRLKMEPEHFENIIVVTAQHRSMLDQMLEVFAITPDVDLNIMEANQSLFQVAQKTLQRLEAVLTSHAPDVILVQGDTTSTLVGALAGFYNKTTIAHVEAGLRTHQKFSPFPEEMNRRLTSVLADIHFPPTSLGKENLLREGARDENIFITGNTGVDAVLSILDHEYRFPLPELNSILRTQLRTIVVTAHRRENWGEAFESVAQAILKLVALHNDIQFIFPVHLNPNVRKTFYAQLQNHARVHLLDPLEYRAFINLLGKAFIILTDSGGIQEEAPSLRKPVLLMREVTERPEALSKGFLKLVGCNVERIVNEATRLLQDAAYYSASTSGANPYGDGMASHRIAQAIKFVFGNEKNRPQDFYA